MVTREWFYRHDGRVYGPVSLDDLRTALALGFLRPTDLVRERIVGDWVGAGTLHAIADDQRSVGVNRRDRASLGEESPTPAPSRRGPTP